MLVRLIYLLKAAVWAKLQDWPNKKKKMVKFTKSNLNIIRQVRNTLLLSTNGKFQSNNRISSHRIKPTVYRIIPWTCSTIHPSEFLK